MTSAPARRVILVHGTFGLSNPWWRPGEPFWRAAAGVGLTPIAAEDPYHWTGRLAGFLGPTPDDPENHYDDAGLLDWSTAGRALQWYWQAKVPPGADGVRPAVCVIAHSHGAQVALFAAGYGMQIDVLVTLGAPVRRDMLRMRRRARLAIRHWVHVAGDRDNTQIAGTVGDGGREVSRAMPEADENWIEPGADHADLYDHARWAARGWWQWLRR